MSMKKLLFSVLIAALSGAVMADSCIISGSTERYASSYADSAADPENMFIIADGGFGNFIFSTFVDPLDARAYCFSASLAMVIKLTSPGFTLIVK